MWLPFSSSCVCRPSFASDDSGLVKAQDKPLATTSPGLKSPGHPEDVYPRFQPQNGLPNQGWSVHSCADGAAIGGFPCGCHFLRASRAGRLLLPTVQSCCEHKTSFLRLRRPDSKVRAIPRIFILASGLKTVCPARMVRTFMCGWRSHGRLPLWLPFSSSCACQSSLASDGTGLLRARDKLLATASTGLKSPGHPEESAVAPSGNKGT